MKLILLDASNLHNGGGVQVASSLIYELSKIAPSDFKFIVSSSTKVFESLPSDTDFDSFSGFVKLDRFGLKGPNKKLVELSKGCDLSLTVFGPQYAKLKSQINVTGFAQPWIAYPENDMYYLMNKLDRLKYKLRFYLQRKFFFRDEHLIVEHESVRKALLSHYPNCPEIKVIENTVSAAFLDSTLRESLVLPDIDNRFVVGFVGRAYPHKNLKILKEVEVVLRKKFDIDVAFLFSLESIEMKSLGFDKIDNFYTCGSISNLQCPSFYKAIDLFVFPTLLECFSVAPLEAMISGVDVLASEREFITEVYGDKVTYFEPLNPEDIAVKIRASLLNEKSKNQVLSLDYTANARAVKYCNIIRELLLRR